MVRQCAFRKPDGHPCRAAPLTNDEFCFLHSLEHAEDVAEARRLGGLRRRREVAVAGAYEFNSLETVADRRRLLDIAALDTLGLENSIARSHTLGYLVGVAAKLLETGELEQRLAALEAVVQGRKALPAPVFFEEQETSEFSEEAEE